MLSNQKLPASHHASSSKTDLTALQQLVCAGDSRALVELLDRADKNDLVLEKNIQGKTALFYAALKSQQSIKNYLINCCGALSLLHDEPLRAFEHRGLYFLGVALSKSDLSNAIVTLGQAIEFFKRSVEAKITRPTAQAKLSYKNSLDHLAYSFGRQAKLLKRYYSQLLANDEVEHAKVCLHDAIEANFHLIDLLKEHFAGSSCKIYYKYNLENYELLLLLEEELSDDDAELYDQCKDEVDQKNDEETDLTLSIIAEQLELSDLLPDTLSPVSSNFTASSTSPVSPSMLAPHAALYKSRPVKDPDEDEYIVISEEEMKSSAQAVKLQETSKNFR